jgi:very-short-patch-repair endonuclease
MLPEEALGSILRSKQVVVVGDPKQMPPTRYMQSTLQDDSDEEEEPNESILDKAMKAFENFRRLSYHYRSEDESLIRFSNNEFYENDLMTVPNLRHDPELGVKFVDAQGVYNTGNADWVSVDQSGQMAGWTRSKNPNPIEANRLVEIIEEEIRERPQWSVGVAVMNLKQAIRVEELFQEKIDNTIQSYLNTWRKTPEYFFIKNLENVQGDERDTIIIATVYGKNHEGRMFQRFGPINAEKGENRINVLVTRAKRRVVVCTSIEPNDISASNNGAQVLRRYLQFAKTGQLEDNSTNNIPDQDHWYDAPWEKWFHDRLEADGYIVNPQVGVSGWRIDLGVMHKDYPDGYLCGVELDGKDHLKQSARDRDIERQSILEDKGWTIFRVWSIDFFSDKEGEYQALKSSIDEILEQKITERSERTEPEILESEDSEICNKTDSELLAF